MSDSKQATGDVDEQDSYAQTDSAYISNFICNTTTAVLFSPTEIVLDNSAGLDVFMNPNLLCDSSPSPIARLGGVNSESGVNSLNRDVLLILV